MLRSSFGLSSAHAPRSSAPGIKTRDKPRVLTYIFEPRLAGPGSFRDMMRCLQCHARTGSSYGTAPEQNFLSSYYRWKESLHWKYNFQLHQLIFTANQRTGTTANRMHLEYEEVAVFHYSTEWKPSRLVGERTSAGQGCDEFMGAFFETFSCQHQEVRDFITKAFHLWWTTYQKMSNHLLEHIDGLLQRNKATRTQWARWRQVIPSMLQVEAEAELDGVMHPRSGSAPSSGSRMGHQSNVIRAAARSRSRSSGASQRLPVGAKFEVISRSVQSRTRWSHRQLRF